MTVSWGSVAPVYRLIHVVPDATVPPHRVARRRHPAPRALLCHHGGEFAAGVELERVNHFLPVHPLLDTCASATLLSARSLCLLGLPLQQGQRVPHPVVSIRVKGVRLDDLQPTDPFGNCIDF